MKHFSPAEVEGAAPREKQRVLRVERPAALSVPWAPMLVPDIEDPAKFGRT